MPQPDKDKQVSVPPRSRFRKLLRVFLLGGGLLFVFGGLLAIGIYLLWSYPAAMEARAELGKIRQEWGVGSLEEMNEFFDLPEGQEDIVPYLNKAWRQYSTIRESFPDPEPDIDETYLPPWREIPQATAKLNPANPNWGHVGTAEKFLDEFQEIIRQVERIAEMDGGFRVPGDWTQGGDGEMSLIRMVQSFSRILVAKNRLSLCKGEVDGAIEASFAALSLIMSVDRTSLIEQLIRSSVLDFVLPSVVSTFPYMRDGDLIKIQERLTEIDFRSALKPAIVCETVTVGNLIQQGDHSLLENVYTGRGALSEGFFGRALLALGRSHDLGRLYGNTNRILSVVDRPWKEVNRLLSTPRFSSRRQLLRAGAILETVLYYHSSGYVPFRPVSFSPAFNSDARVQAAIAVAGIERFLRKHGRLPANLEELPAVYLPGEVRDPYTQGPLKYSIGDYGYTIYSFGGDGEDDGGIDLEFEIESLDDIAIRVPLAGLSAASRPLDKITESVLELPGGHGPVLGVVFSPDGKILVSGCYDGEIQIRDAASGKLLQGLGGHKGPAACVAFSPDGAILLSGGGGWNREDDRFGEIFSWNTRTWEKNAVKNIDLPVTAIAFSPKGTEALVGTSGREVDAIYSAMGFSRRLDPRTLSWGADPVVVKTNVKAVSFSPDGESAGILLSPWFSSNPGRILDVRSGKRYRLDGSHLSEELKARGVGFGYSESIEVEFSRQEVTHGTAGFTNLDFSPDSKLMAFGGYGALVEIWAHRDSSGARKKPAGGPSRGKLFRVLAGHSRAVTSVAFSPDGKTLASGSGDHTLRLWNVKDGRCLASFEGHSLGVNAVAFSPDGKRIASASTDGSVRVWEVPSTE